MDSMFADPAKCSNPTLEEKRVLVHEISQWAENAPEILQSWSRRDLLHLICAEMGKERKYTGVPKSKMIDHLLKLVSKKNAKVHNHVIGLSSALPKNQTGPKNKRKKENPPLTYADLNQGEEIAKEEEPDVSICKNPVCRAPLRPDIGYCKRCSCCICHSFDENKDPSLWLNCNSDPPFCSQSCGMSCHLKCALKQDKSGILKFGHFSKLDGGFYCVCCGKVNWLIGCWRKQLLIAKEARRVDVLCNRLSLVHKMLKGSEYYKELENIVGLAVKTLKKEVGPLDKVSSAMARGIVNRLNCGAEVQKLCGSAFEAVDSVFSSSLDFLADSEAKSPVPVGAQALIINFEDITAFSVVVTVHARDHMFEDKIIGCTLWHRSSNSTEYPEEPTCLIMRPDTKITISGLYPSTEYYFKVSPFSTTKELGKWEAKCMTDNVNDNGCEFSIHNSVSIFMPENILPDLKKEQDSVIIQADSQKGSTNSSENRHEALQSEDTSDNNQRHLQVQCNDTVPFLSSDSSLDVPVKPDRINRTPDSANKKEESKEGEYEYCVKVIRWLECEGHMGKDFRVKFLTWFSLKATAQERRVVSAFIDILIDEPASLVAQLMDSFMDGVCNKEKLVARTGLCNKLWL